MPIRWTIIKMQKSPLQSDAAAGCGDGTAVTKEGEPTERTTEDRTPQDQGCPNGMRPSHRSCLAMEVYWTAGDSRLDGRLSPALPDLHPSARACRAHLLRRKPAPTRREVADSSTGTGGGTTVQSSSPLSRSPRNVVAEGMP